jgi:glycerol uptake facilitator-like aquaporin
LILKAKSVKTIIAMNNFKVALNSWFNPYYAFNEALGSFFLMFFIIIAMHFFYKNFKNKALFSIIVGIIFIFILIFTLVLGELYGGSGNVIGFLNPISVLAHAALRNMFKGVLYLIGFEFIGTFIGFILGILIIRLLGTGFEEFGEMIELDDSPIIRSALKEMIMIIFLTLGILSI